MFEFRISFSALIYLGGSNVGVRILILANYFSSVRISNFFFCRQFMIFYFYSVALRAASILKNHVFPPFGVALRAAWILKNHLFCICLISSRLQNTFIWLDLSIGSMLELLVLKNAVECTSQRLKWTSRARVLTI